MEVKINGQLIELQPPASMAVRYDIAEAASTNSRRSFMAALGVCWVGCPAKITYAKAGYNPLAYGGRLLDELLEQGFDWGQLQAAAAIAYTLVSAGLWRDEDEPDEVDAAEGNSPSAEGSTS